ncbi:hypothetical protein [Methylobacterium sp. AMS5]|uniref:hypothetical protein n=1 Tax=Methylobacterium sp. AMS5 TaxID=925818 RepID=UPI00074F9A78|nr:hypothetical protein [Methylobacterium sp. AMS5]AMB48265.1 hypothetical protein Y590_25190 [Methylobacterium sp. AMS5]
MRFTGTAEGMLSRLTGHNRTGEPIYGAPAPARVGVIHLLRNVAITSVRTDGSASRGAAEENTASAKILFEVDTAPRLGDRFVIMGQTLRVESLEPRLDVFGSLDHYEALLVLWEGEDV